MIPEPISFLDSDPDYISTLPRSEVYGTRYYRHARHPSPDGLAEVCSCSLCSVYVFVGYAVYCLSVQPITRTLSSLTVSVVAGEILTVISKLVIGNETRVIPPSTMAQKIIKKGITEEKRMKGKIFELLVMWTFMIPHTG